jgi:preprotein translocase subunit SecD
MICEQQNIIVVHPHTFRVGKGVKKIEVECDGQMELGQLVKKITDRKVEIFQMKNENLEKVKQSSKAKHFDRKTIECFEIRKQGEEYVNLKFEVFNATKKPNQK